MRIFCAACVCHLAFVDSDFARGIVTSFSKQAQQPALSYKFSVTMDKYLHEAFPSKIPLKEGDDECGPTYRPAYAKDGAPLLDHGVTTCYESFQYVTLFYVL